MLWHKPIGKSDSTVPFGVCSAIVTRGLNSQLTRTANASLDEFCSENMSIP